MEISAGGREAYRQVTEAGGVFSHCPESVTPEANCAQALVIAEIGRASCRERV